MEMDYLRRKRNERMHFFHNCIFIENRKTVVCKNLLVFGVLQSKSIFKDGKFLVLPEMHTFLFLL